MEKHINGVAALQIGLSIIEIFSFPIGTAIGIYSIWALIQPEAVNAFTPGTVN